MSRIGRGYPIHAKILKARVGASGTGSAALSAGASLSETGTPAIGATAAFGAGATLTSTSTTAAAFTAGATLTATGVNRLTCRVGALGTTGFSANIDTNTTGSTCRLAVSTSSGMTSPVYNSGTATAVDSYGLLTLAITGLTADTDYWYQFEVNGALAGPIGRAHTAPSTTAAGYYSFLAHSCAYSNNQASWTNNAVFANMLARTNPTTGKLALFQADLGDIHYDDITTHHGGSQSLALNLVSMRGVYAQSNRAALDSQIPKVYTESDHDYGSDNCDGSDANGQYFLSAYREFFPHYALVPDTNGDTGAAGGLGVYHTFTIGQVCYVVTDGRSYMDSITKTDNSSKTKLGATQKAWLKATMAAAVTANLAICWLHEDAWNNPGTYVGDDTWGAYQTERAELVTYFTANGILPRLIYIHGDYHVIAADDGTNNPWGGFPTVCASPTDQTTFRGSATMSAGFYPNPTNNSVRNNHYQWVNVHDQAGSVSFAFTGYDATSGTDVSEITMTSTINLNFTGTAAFGAGASLSATGKPAETGTAALTAGASLSASGKPAETGTAAYTAGASLTVAGSPGETGVASLPAGASLAETGIPAVTGTATYTAGAALTAAGKPAISNTAAYATGATLTMTFTVTIGGIASLTAGATLTATGATNGSASVTAGAALSMTDVPAFVVATAFNAGALLTITAKVTTGGPAALTAAASLTITGAGSGGTSYTAGASLTAAASVALANTAAFNARATLSATGSTPSGFRDLKVSITTGTDKWTVTTGSDHWNMTTLLEP